MLALVAVGGACGLSTGPGQLIVGDEVLDAGLAGHAGQGVSGAAVAAVPLVLEAAVEGVDADHRPVPPPMGRKVTSQSTGR